MAHGWDRVPITQQHRLLDCQFLSPVTTRSCNLVWWKEVSWTRSLGSTPSGRGTGQQVPATLAQGEMQPDRDKTRVLCSLSRENRQCTRALTKTSSVGRVRYCPIGRCVVTAIRNYSRQPFSVRPQKGLPLRPCLPVAGEY